MIFLLLLAAIAILLFSNNSRLKKYAAYSLLGVAAIGLIINVIGLTVYTTDSRVAVTPISEKAAVQEGGIQEAQR